MRTRVPRRGIVYYSIEMRTGLRLLPAAALTVWLGSAADRPPLQDAAEWPEPTDRTPLRVNPPTFRWPAGEVRGPFTVQLARSPEFQGAASAEVAESFYRPLKALEPGRWYWRVRPRAGEWTAAESFEISPALPRWEIPEWSRLLEAVPKARPRIYLRPDEVAGYRNQARGPLRELVQEWERRRARSIGAQIGSQDSSAGALPATASDKSDKEGALRRQKVLTWAAKSGSHQLMDPVGDLCWLWMLTGEEKYAAEAGRRVLAATRLDPRTELSDDVSDFANANIVGQAGVAYDLLHDRFSSAERDAIRAMLVARIEPILRKVERAPRRMFQAHGWQRAYLEGVIGALALYGDEPVARRWLETGLKMFVAFYPWFGGLDGGSAEGSNYYTCCNMLSSLATHDVFQAAFGLNLARDNPWYRGNPYYLIYALPPGGMRSLFGDVNPDLTKEGAGAQHRLAALRMASLHKNGYAADYAARLGGRNDADHGLERFRWSSPHAVERVPLETLPPARAFWDIGMVFMHSALTRPEANVRLEFRSSPYGATGHGHSDQNAFNIIAFNEPLILDSGYYTAAGDRHHAGWARQTKAHNTVLVDGTGQIREEGAGPRRYGLLTRFEQTADWVYTAGDAAAAYSQVGLERFDRHIVWLRGRQVQTYVIIDDLAVAAGRPHRYDWLLHAAREMRIDQAARRVLVANGPAEARVSILEPATVSFRQTDRFDPPPENWRPDRKYTLKDQWHLTVASQPAASVRYIAVIQVSIPGFEPSPVERLESGARVEGWDVRLEGRRVSVARAK